MRRQGPFAHSGPWLTREATASARSKPSRMWCQIGGGVRFPPSSLMKVLSPLLAGPVFAIRGGSC